MGSLSKIWGWDSVNSVWVKLLVDSNGKVQVDTKSSALPIGASTSANQTIMITALQLIDDLRNALGSVNTDDLQVDVKDIVDGEIKNYGDVNGSWKKQPLIFGYTDTYYEKITADSAGTSLLILGTAVASGYIHIVRNCGIRNQDGDMASGGALYVSDGTTNYIIQQSISSFAQWFGMFWNGKVVLKQGYYIVGEALGIASGETIELTISGYKMRIS